MRVNRKSRKRKGKTKKLLRKMVGENVDSGGKRRNGEIEV